MGNYTNQVPRQQMQVQRRQQRPKAVKGTKPHDAARQLLRIEKMVRLNYTKPAGPTNLQPHSSTSTPEPDIAAAIVQVGGLIHFFLEIMEASRDRSITVRPRWGRAPISSGALFFLVFLNLLTSTAAGPYRDKRSSGGAKRFTAEELENMRQRLNLTVAHSNGNNNPVSNLDNHPRGDLNNVIPNDPTQTHRRRLGDTHDRPVAHPAHDPDFDPTYNWDLDDDLDMNWDIYSHNLNAGDATVYPIEKISVFMEKLITAASSLPDLIARVLRKMGIDPNKELSANIYQIDQDHPVTASSVTPIELVMHFCTSERLGFQVTAASDETADFIERITNSNEYHRDSFLSRRVLKPLEHGFRNKGEAAILEKLKEFGINPDDKATLRRVTANRRVHTEIGVRGNAADREGDLGTIIDVEKDGEIQRFAIVPHHPNGIIRLPHNHQQWKGWMHREGKALFFRDPGALPHHVRFHIDIVEGSPSPIDTVHKAIKKTLKPIVKRTLEHIVRLMTHNSTGYDAVHMILGLYVPYYDFARAVMNDDHEGALIILGFELVPMAGDSVKKLFRIKKIPIPKSIKLISNDVNGHEVASQAFESAKTVNGLGFFKSRPKLTKTGGRQVASAINEQQSKE